MQRLELHNLGRRPCAAVYDAMRQFTDLRDPQTPDALWVVEHDPVFTLGLNAKPEHLLAPGDIPVLQVDRGGQVTYHGPGQVVVYALIDLRRRRLGVRALVTALEQAVVRLLAGFGIEAAARADAPGVYVDGAKIASLGLRVRRGCSYHGLAFNHDMDLSPFSRINPCGMRGLPVTSLARLGVQRPRDEIAHALCVHLAGELGYTGLPERLPEVAPPPLTENAT